MLAKLIAGNDKKLEKKVRKFLKSYGYHDRSENV